MNSVCGVCVCVCVCVCVYVLVTQLCLILFIPMDYRPPCPLSMEFSRQEYWSAIPFSRGSSRPRDLTQVSCMAGRFFTLWATMEAPNEQKIQLNMTSSLGNFSEQHAGVKKRQMERKKNPVPKLSTYKGSEKSLLLALAFQHSLSLSATTEDLQALRSS